MARKKSTGKTSANAGEGAGNVILILTSEDIQMSLLVAQQLDDYRVVTFDPGLLDKLHADGMPQAEYISFENCPNFVDLHEVSRTRALQIEETLLKGVRHIVPTVDNMGWNHLDFYYFIMAKLWYSSIAENLSQKFAGQRLHVLVNDNPLGFFWPSFVPAVTILERLNVLGTEFQAHSYGVRNDETNVVPALLGENADDCDLLTHLPTCMHDTKYLQDELTASGKVIFDIAPKYWAITVEAQRSFNLCNVADVLRIIPEDHARRIEEFRDIMMARLEVLMRPYISTESYRQRQIEHWGNLYRAQFITFYLLNIFFRTKKPRKILLSDHEAGFHGPIVAFAEAANIPVLLFPHSKTTPDTQFSRKNVTVLTHPIQGYPIFDSKQKLMENIHLAYPEQFSGASTAPQPLKRVGLLLNAMSLNGIMVSGYPAFIDGIRQIADWCRERGLELSVRGRPGSPISHLLKTDAGIDVEEMRIATAIPLAAFAQSIDICVMYDAPTTGELEFLRNGVPLINPIPEPLSKYEAVICNTKVVPQLDIQDTLFMLASFVDDPFNFHAFRTAQFSDYVGLFRNAKSLRSLL